MLGFDSHAPGPDTFEDKSGNDETEEDSDHAIADVIEICVGRVPLKDAVEESECDLQPSVTDPFASGRDPASDGSGTSDEDDEGRDRFHARHPKHNGQESERSAN